MSVTLSANVTLTERSSSVRLCGLTESLRRATQDAQQERLPEPVVLPYIILYLLRSTRYYGFSSARQTVIGDAAAVRRYPGSTHGIQPGRPDQRDAVGGVRHLAVWPG